MFSSVKLKNNFFQRLWDLFQISPFFWPTLIIYKRTYKMIFYRRCILFVKLETSRYLTFIYFIRDVFFLLCSARCDAQVDFHLIVVYKFAIEVERIRLLVPDQFTTRSIFVNYSNFLPQKIKVTWNFYCILWTLIRRANTCQLPVVHGRSFWKRICLR